MSGKSFVSRGGITKVPKKPAIDSVPIDENTQVFAVRPRSLRPNEYFRKFRNIGKPLKGRGK
jgi:hypothetical protein